MHLMMEKMMHKKSSPKGSPIDRVDRALGDPRSIESDRALRDPRSIESIEPSGIPDRGLRGSGVEVGSCMRQHSKTPYYLTGFWGCRITHTHPLG